jgi:glycosyltransferase involved in cell wall biosynthesis
LTIGRARGYKHTDVVCRAMAALPDERLVVIGAVRESSWPPNVVVPDGIGDAQLRWLYANAAGLIAVAHEDFGLTPVEAQAFGIPVVALRAGGYLDTTVEGSTGVFVDAVTPGAVAEGIRHARARQWNREVIRRMSARYAPEAFAARMHDLTSAVVADRADVRYRR